METQEMRARLQSMENKMDYIITNLLEQVEDKIKELETGKETDYNKKEIEKKSSKKIIFKDEKEY